MPRKIDLIDKRFGKLTVVAQIPPGRSVCVCDCGNIITVFSFHLRRGDTTHCGCLKRRNRNPNQYYYEDNYCVMNVESYLIKLDIEDVDRVKQHYWYPLKYNGSVRIVADIDQKTTYISRFILNGSKKIVDHINRDTMDNRKENLREVNDSQSLMNRGKGKRCTHSKYKGVYKVGKKFRACICHNHIGMFPTEEMAALAYDVAAKEQFGEYAALNFPNLE